MKHLIIVLVALFSISLNSQAQNTYKKRTADEKAIFFTKEITDYLGNASDEQTAQLVQINKTTTLAFDSLKALQLESNDYKPAARGIFVTRDEAIKKVLTPAQWDEYLMLQAEKRVIAKKKREAQGAALTLNCPEDKN
jgi:hypothetical protein